MQTVLQIIEKAGGFRPSLYLKIDNRPYMELVIEAVGEPGPLGLPSVSVAHYGEQNGDAMRDPEMCFELVSASDGALSLNPFLLPKRLCRRRAVEPESCTRSLRPACRAPQAARTLRANVGQQPAPAELRRRIRCPAHPRLTPWAVQEHRPNPPHTAQEKVCRPSRNGKKAACSSRRFSRLGM